MRVKRTIYLVTLLLLIATAVSGCKGKEDVVTNDVSEVLEKSQNYYIDNNTLDAKVNQSNEEDESIAPTYELMSNQEIYIYSINSSTLEKEAITAIVPEGEDITPQLIVDTVIDSLEDESFLVDVDEVSTQEDSVIISFTKEYIDVISLSNEVEVKILDVIAQSLLDNLDSYRKVIFRVNGKAYESKNLSFSIDQVYLEKAN